MCLTLEGGLHIQAFAVVQFKAFFHQLAVGLDVDAPLAELVDLTLFFADHYGHQGFAHPGQLPLAEDQFLFIARAAQLLFQLSDTFLPAVGNQRVHAGTGDFVDTHQHGFAGFPTR
ncbi:hypothetical protein D9M70_572410 [compost metagenome]